MCTYDFRSFFVMKSLFGRLRVLGIVTLLVACSPEVGSRKWCEKMQDKPEGDWTLTEAKDYAKHCLFK
jgi:hypothetical protein